jgi:Tol biopolymer transport system component
MRWVVALVGLGACGRIGFDAHGPAGDASGNDALADVAPDATCNWGPFEPATHADNLASALQDYASAVTADNLHIIFDSNRSGGNYDLYEATRTDPQSMFTNVTALTTLNTGSADSNPAISPDGLTLYFTSTVTGQDRIYVAKRGDVSQAFGAAVVVPGMLGTLTADSPSISPDELSMYFERTLAGNYDIYVATRSTTADPWDTITAISAINTPMDDNVPSISSDGLELFFSHKPGGVGTDALYVSRRASTSDPFPAATAITELDGSGTEESDPTISYDGRTLWFAVYGIDADIYSAQRSCL